MTETQIVPTASDRTTLVEDSKGRVLTVRRFTVSERMRFYKLIPKGAQENAAWLTTALVIASVLDIDGTPCSPLTNEADLERRGDMLGDEGIEAATLALAGMMPTRSPQETLAAAGE